MGNKVFISYRRNEPDQSVATYLESALNGAGFAVFRDVNTPVGARWAEEIQRQLLACDYFVILISEQSMDRDMVRQEIQQAHALNRQHQKPLIFPVRLAYRGALPYDLAAWLDPLQYALWESKADSQRLADELVRALRGTDDLPHRQTRDAAAQQALLAATEQQGFPLPKAEPVMDVLALHASNPFYVERDVDRDFFDTLCYDNGVATLHGPRQMGKSSLFNRIRPRLEQAGRKSVFLDLKLLAAEPIADAAGAFESLAMLISEQLGDVRDPSTFFAGKGFVARKFETYLAQVVGTRADRPVLLFDDVDAVFEKSYRDALFGGLRYIIDQKAQVPELRQIGFGFAHSHDPAFWIQDAKQSPFNVARVYTVPEFTRSQTDWLNQQHTRQLTVPEIATLSDLLGGHPYLTRIALYCIAGGGMSFPQLQARAADDDGPFGDHLRARLWSVIHAGLAKPFKRILDVGKCGDIMQFQGLLAMGLVRGRSHLEAAPRFGLYRDYFQPLLDV